MSQQPHIKGETDPVRYFLGVDGGGSKTTAAVINEEGQVLGAGRSGGSNHQICGMEAALVNVHGAIDGALVQAGLQPSDIHHAVFGLAGADRPYDMSIILPAIETLPLSSWRVVGDTMIGLRSGSPSNTGVVLICGSGTSAAGRNLQGDELMTGGFGYLYGDWGGGFDLARETFRMAIRSWEHREPPSVLTRMVPEFLGYRDVETMYNDCLDHVRDDVPFDLTLVLHDAANMGDPVALSVLSRLGHELGLAAHSVATRLTERPIRAKSGAGTSSQTPALSQTSSHVGTASSHEPMDAGMHSSMLPKPFDLVLIGSVLQKGRHPQVIGGIEDVLKPHGWNYSLRIPDVPPVHGALLLACDDAGFRAPQIVDSEGYIV